VVDKESDLKSLNPYLEDGILRVGGRIDALPGVARSMNRPVILPKGHHITSLIIDAYHRRFLHSSDETVVNELRQEFWIPHMRVAVRKVKLACQICKNRAAKPASAQMCPLPSARLSPFFSPFAHTGLDYFGPVEIVIGRRREKRWIALFTCLTIRAIHMEIARSLSADSCILAIRNFINRRGCPVEIHSDNGTNFKGAHTELKTALAGIDYEQIADTFTMRGIKWITIPPYSPHKGGSWERMVRSVKNIVGIVLHSKALQEDTLRSFLIEAEYIINSRPLMYIPLESDLEEALTPNHFLLLSSHGRKERWDFKEGLLRKQWKISQELANHFWTRWVREYAPTILRRTKWAEDGLSLEVGDVVIILDPKAPRNDWAKGVIIETIASIDGKIRTVRVKTNSGVKTRSIHNLAVLDVRRHVE
jgi:transposase InsO family protein